ncbi:MAG TPA: ABC transporter permease [Candidatus Acidoferrales bacterium]|nr:ABC transporter permease [Candidatus Acidoferrales bacterium]
MPLTEDIGGATLDSLAYVGNLARLAAGAARAVFIDPFRGGKIRWSRAVHQAMAVGVGAIPVVSLISFFVGLILALQAAYELRTIGAMHLVAGTVAVAVTRELGPLMTAVVVVGRSGSAFAAEIGTMKVNEEIDALETMALEPVPFLVAPKFVAMLLMMPCLTTWSDFMGILGGGVFGVLSAGFSWLTYLHATFDTLVQRDILMGLVKSVMFAIVITAVGCQEGFTTGLGSEEVGKSTTAAVVKSIFLVVVMDLVFTAIFYITAPK